MIVCTLVYKHNYGQKTWWKPRWNHLKQSYFYIITHSRWTNGSIFSKYSYSQKLFHTRKKSKIYHSAPKNEALFVQDSIKQLTKKCFHFTHDLPNMKPFPQTCSRHHLNILLCHAFVIINTTQPHFGQVYKVKDENMKKLHCLSFHMVCRLMF